MRIARSPEKKAYAVQKVFIHTNELGEVHPFGKNTFEKRVSELRGDLRKVHFMGDKVKLVSPDQSLCFLNQSP